MMEQQTLYVYIQSKRPSLCQLSYQENALITDTVFFPIMYHNHLICSHVSSVRFFHRNIS